MVNKFILLLLGVFAASQLEAQSPVSLTLDAACDSAAVHYPITRQRGLIAQTAGLSVENLGKAYVPQISVSGQATYQSDVTQLKIPLPGFTVDPLSKDQYKLVTEVSQLIYDGGGIKNQKELQGLNATIEVEKVEVELYKLRERVTQVFLGILFLDEQLKQIELVEADINNGILRTEAQVKNGVAFRSNLNLLKAELLKAKQRRIELTASRKGWLGVLGLFLGTTLPESIELITPNSPAIANSIIDRPELRQLSAQQKAVGLQAKLIDSRNLPKASLFVQGGYGRPGLNFLDNNFRFFYMGGVRFNWSIGGMYTQKRDKQLLNITGSTIDLQKEAFLLNTQTQLRQQQAEIDKQQELLETDNEIIGLRESVVTAVKAQLDNGVITASDYLREVNAADQARQTKTTHKVQLLQAQINYQLLTGKK